MIPARIKKEALALAKYADSEVKRIKSLPAAKRRKAAKLFRENVRAGIVRIGKDAAMEACMSERRKKHPDEDMAQSVAVCLSKLGRSNKS